MTNSVVLLLIVCFCANHMSEVVAKTGDLLSTAILFRHGQRTAVEAFKNLPCSSCRNLGEGQLTKNGSYQLFQLGEHLRPKYSSLFPKDGIFRVRNMQLMSSQPDRCIMSLQSFMAGFFPPFTFGGLGQIPIDWQPISFRIDNIGNILHFDANPDSCPAYFEVLEEKLKKPPYSTLTEEYRAMLSEKSGRNMETVWDVLYLGDHVDTQLELNESIPQWLIDEKTFLSSILADFFRIAHGSKFMLKVRAGRLMTQIVENMVNVADGIEPRKQFLIYSAHDMTVTTLAYALGVEDQLPGRPLYGDTIMVDLIEDNENDHQVQVKYFRFSTGQTIAMEIPNCKEPCRLDRFVTLFRDLMLNEKQWNDLCGLRMTKSSSNRNSGGVTCNGVSGTMILAIGLIIKGVQLF